MLVDVTAQTASGFNDDESLPITKCVCGAKFEYWDFFVGLGEDSAAECPKCGRKLCFSVDIRIYEVRP